MITAMLGLLALAITNGLTVFDCKHPMAKYWVLDLTGPAPCPDPTNDYRKPVKQQVQVITTNTAQPVQGYRCKVAVSKMVTRCGFDSITYGIQWPVWEQDYPITQRQCQDIIRRREFHMEGRVLTINLAQGKTDHRFYTHGNLDTDGYCTTESFTTAGTKFENSYEDTSIKIITEAIGGTRDASSGLVQFPNGIRGPYTSGYLHHPAEGTIIWDVTNPSCEDLVSTIYTGSANLHVRTNKPGLPGALLMIANDQTNQYAGFVLRNPVTICNANCHSTQTDGLVVCLRSSTDEPLEATFNPSADFKTIHLVTQLNHLHLAAGLRMYNRFEEVQQQICQLERNTLANKLQAISGGSNPHALLDLYGPGHRVFTAGAVAYVTRCVAVEATRTEYPNCTEEVPMSVNGSLHFADPFTWNLREFPTIVPCSSAMPVRWKINGDWYCAKPGFKACEKEPKQLQPTLFDNHQAWDDFTTGVGASLVSAGQMLAHKAFTQVQQARNSIVSALAHNAVVNGVGDHFGLPFSTFQMNAIGVHVTSHIFPTLSALGETWTILSALMFLALIIKVAIDCIGRAFVLYRERGCTPWMFAALWGLAFQIAMTPVNLVYHAAKVVTRRPAPPSRSDRTDDPEYGAVPQADPIIRN